MWMRIVGVRATLRERFRWAVRGGFGAIAARVCGRTFDAAPGTPLSGLRRKERWLSFGASLSEGETVQASAARCGVAVTTALRWRRRFPRAVGMTPEKLRGIVEDDETYVLRSRKGKRKPDRKARPPLRGGRLAAARPRSGACRAIGFRFLWPPTAAGLR